MIRWLRSVTHRGRHRRRSLPVHPWLMRHFVDQGSGNPTTPTSHAV